MAIADRDLDRVKKIAIDDQKIADQSCLAHKALQIARGGKKFEFDNLVCWKTDELSKNLLLK